MKNYFRFSKLGKSIGGAVVALALGLSSPIVHAGQTPIMSIYGAYDTGGIGDLPSSITSGLAQYGSSGTYDTPTLFFVNTTGYTITNAQMVLTDTPSVNNGLNTINNGVTQTVSLSSIGPQGITQVSWYGSGPLNNYDYDDNYTYYGSGIGAGGGGAANPASNGTSCMTTWYQFCSPIGNFKVQFSGTLSGTGSLNGQSVAAVFGETTVGGNYIGWEGVDPNGWAENPLYDQHSSSTNGVLANIYVGTISTVPTSPVPEPEAYAMMLAGFGLMGFMVRRKKSA